MKKLMVVFVCMLVFLCGCGAKEEVVSKDVNISKLFDDMKATLDQQGAFIEMMDFTSDDMTLLYGIETAEVSQFAGSISKVGTNSDEILLLEVSASADAKKVAEKLETRYQAKANEAKDYLPKEYEKIQNCTVLQNGNFIALIVHSEYATLKDMWTQAVQ